MSNNDNMSIDDIIRQAEEIRKKTVARAQAAVEEVKKTAENSASDEVRAYTPSQAKADKTAVIDSGGLKRVDGGISDDDKTKNLDQRTRAVSLDGKTAVVSTGNSDKKSFFKNKAREQVYSNTPPETIEKPATIKSKSRFDHTSDLEEIPTIVAVEELEHTKISIGSSNLSRADSGEFDSDESDQIVLDGFEDSTEEISKIDEELAEKQLKQRRQEKVNKFRLFSPDDISDDRQSAIKNEYRKDDDKTVFMEKLFASKSSFTLKGSITLALSALLMLMVLFKDSAYMPDFLLDYTSYCVTQLVLYVLIMVVNIKNIIFGFKFSRGINYSYPISVASLMVLVHSILLIVDSDLYIDGGIAFPLVMAFAFVMTNAGKRTMIARIIENFEYLVALEDKYAVETIVNSVDATIISRGVLTGEPNLKTSIKTDFSTNFLDISSSDEPADKIAKTTGTIMMVMSLILFIALSIVKDNWYLGFNTAVCALCVSLPVVSIFNTNRALLGVSRKIKKNGAMINGFEGASTVNDANAVVMEAQDLFSKNSCEIHGIKTFNGAKADDVILKTAAVVMKTKSPLSYVFDDVIIGKQTILPDVDGVVYENGLGTSAWIYKKKILVGTRDLLIHHGVQVPKEEFEKKYTRKGRKTLYLAVAGKLAAMFVVSYSADSDLKKSLKHLEKSGITILVKSSDPFINDESIAELFGLPDGFIRVMNSSNARVFEKYSDMCVEKSPAYAVHNGTALGLVSVMSAAENLDETKKLLSVLITFGCAMGFGIAAMLGFIDGLGRLDAVSIVVFQAVWCIFVEIVSKIKRLGL